MIWLISLLILVNVFGVIVKIINSVHLYKNPNRVKRNMDPYEEYRPYFPIFFG